MTREDIIRMAREAGWSGIYTQWREPDGSPDWTPVKESLTVPVTMEQIERFAALVAAAEREACVQIIEEYQIPVGNSPAGELACEWTYDALKEIRDDIRARGNT